MSKRALILVLSIVIVGIILAGLQGILNLMATHGPLENTSVRPTESVNSLPVTAKSNLPSTPNAGQKLPTKFPFDITKSNSQTSVFPALDILAQSSLSPHIPLFKMTGNLGSSYLRSTVASMYHIPNWQYDNTLPLIKYTGEKLNYSVEDYDRKSLSNIEITPVSDFAAVKMPIPAGQYVNKLTSQLPLSFDAENRVFVSATGMPTSYSFESIKYVFDEETLTKAKIDPAEPDMIVPSSTSERSLSLVKSITGNIDSPYLKAKAIEQYLKDNYVYDFNYQPAPNGQDPNEWFLFEEQKGICTNFNSAFVVLCREAGIPARLVGGYSVDPLSPSQVVYADQAHAWAEIKLERTGWITFDATGSNQHDLIGTNTLITKVDSIVDKSTPFKVTGIVTAENTAVEGVLVELYINNKKSIQNGTLVGQAIVDHSEFEINANIPPLTPVGNYQLIAHSAETPRFAESASDPAIKVMASTVLSITSLPIIKTGQTININGQLTETSKQILIGQTIDIDINGQLLAHVITDNQGKFAFKTLISQSGEYDIQAKFPGNQFFYASNTTSSFQALNPTTLTIQTPPKIKAGHTLKIEGDLKNSSDSKPISNQTLELSIEGVPTGLKAKTDNSGHFVLEYKMKKSGIFQVNVKYISQPYNSDAAASSVVEVTAANNKTILGLLLMLSGAFIASGYVGFRYLRKRKTHFWRKTKTLIAPASGVEQNTREESPSVPLEATSELIIDFPNILPSLPDVWGVGEELEVTCQLNDTAGAPLSAKEIEILMGSPITTLTTDINGKTSVTLAFSEKGYFEIEAIYHSPGEIEADVQNLKMIRIVDYREEIILEYKSLLDWFSRFNQPVSQNITPGDFKQLLLNSGLPVSLNSVETFITCFEEANYSLHPIERQNYVNMFFAQDEIRKHETQTAQSAE